MARLADGETTALNQLIQRWQRPLRSFVLRSVLNESDADDILQETFLRVYRHRRRFRPDSRFSTWLFAIALNLCRNHLARAYRRRTDALEDHIATASPPAADTPLAGQQLLADERACAVRDAIHALPDDQRAAVLLFEYEGFSVAEIAEIEGTTAKAIENRLYRARQNLRRSLSRWLARD